MNADRILVGLATVAGSILLALAAWGLIGSILYVRHNEMLANTVTVQQQQMVQWQRAAQAKHDSLQAALRALKEGGLLK